MSQTLMCAVCISLADQKDLGNVSHNGAQRHLFRCTACGQVWEETTIRKPVKKTDPVLKVLVG